MTTTEPYAHNQSLDTLCKRRRFYSWGTSYQIQRDDGRWEYGDGGNSYVSLMDVPATSLAGKVVYLKAAIQNHVSDISSRLSWCRSVLWTQAEDTVIRMTVQLSDDIPSDAGQPQIRITGMGFFVPMETAVYTPDDWRRVEGLYVKRMLAEPYFNGDTMPR